jgi:tetratricopeptide (TPR) repeat protein
VKLKEAKAEGERAVDIASSGSASAAVQQQAAAFLSDAQERLKRWQKNDTLRGALLDVSTPKESRSYQADASGRMMALAQRSVDEQYATAFQRWGLDVDGTAESAVIARLRQEPVVVVQEVIAGLDNWMLARRRKRDEPGSWRLFRITEQLDRSDTRRQLRALALEKSPPGPTAIAGLLAAGRPWPALWELGRGKTWRRVQELRGQLDLLRDPVGTVVLLARAYTAAGDAVGAVEVLRQAAELRPNQLVLLEVLARLLEEQGQWEAIGCYRAIRVRRPEQGVALAKALRQIGREREGETVLRELVRQQPRHPDLYLSLADLLSAKGQVEEAIQHYRTAIQLDPKNANAHNNLGIALEAKGKVEEAIKHYRTAIHLDPNYTMAHGALGQALLEQGRFAQARGATRRCLDLLLPNHPLRKGVTQQLARRQRLLDLEDKLLAVLHGEVNPADAADRIALAQLCQRSKQLYVASARFYTEAFADQPRLAQNLPAGHRHDAACAAALAACGKGMDGDTLDGKERARLRQQALDWLRADLPGYIRVLDKGPPQARPVIQRRLQRSQNDPDLASLRDKEPLAKLPEAQRQAWTQLWADVADLLQRAQAK